MLLVHNYFKPLLTQVFFYHGQSIISACLAEGIVESVYPLQNKVKMLCTIFDSINKQSDMFLKEFLKKFGPEWYQSYLKKQPVEKVREYFGESVGIYFCFVGKHSYLVIETS